MLSTGIKDRPLGVQILGCEEEFLLRAIEVINNYDFALMDFNAACPAKKVVRRGEGASLMKEPRKLQSLLKLAVQNARFPVTVKMRIGWDSSSVNARDLALRAQDAGAKAIFIHGRTRIQEYSGDIDYGAIRRVKEALAIPLIGSGNIFCASSAKKMFDETGCDGIAIARGALGNPWIFKEIESFLKNGKVIKKPGHKEIMQVMLEHLDGCIDFYGEKRGVIIFRKFFSWYTKGFRKIRPLREKFSRVKTRIEVEKVIEGLG